MQATEVKRRHGTSVPRQAIEELIEWVRHQRGRHKEPVNRVYADMEARLCTLIDSAPGFEGEADNGDRISVRYDEDGVYEVLINGKSQGRWHGSNREGRAPLQ